MRKESLRIFMTALEAADGKTLDNWHRLIKEKLDTNQDIELQWQAHQIRQKIAELGSEFLLTEVEQKTATAMELIDSGDYEAARELCTEVIHAEPMFIEAHIRLAIVESKTKVSLDPFILNSRMGVAEILHDCAVALSKLGYPENAKDGYQKSIFLDPTNYLAITNLGWIFFKEGDPERAKHAYLAAASHPHYDVKAMFNLAHTHASLEENDDAIIWYERTILTDPNSYEAMVNLSNIFEERGEIDAAEKLLKRALAIEPKDTIGISQLAYIYRKRNQLFEAELLYRKSVGVNRNNALANFNLADFLMEHGDHAEAQYFFDRAYELDTNGDLKKGLT